MLKISYAGCLGLSPAISSQFNVEMCAASKNCEKFTKNLFVRGSRSFKIIDVDKSEKPVTSACYISNTCNRFHTIRANNGKKRLYKDTPLLRPRSRGTFAPTGTKFCRDKLDSDRSPQ